MIAFLHISLIVAIVPYILLILIILGSIRFRNKRKNIDFSEKNFSAPVSIILSCYNEEKHVFRKITSLLDENDWIAGSEIIVVSGGSIDATNEQLRLFEKNPNVQLHIFNERVPKIKGINLAASFAKNDFLVFSDFRQDMKKGSIPALMNYFNDQSIGIVAASLIDTKKGSKPSFARSLMNKMGIHSSKYSSSLTIFGALYAQRKETFREIPNDILFDDLYVTVSILGQKYRLVQAKEAIIYDFNFNNYYDKERIMRLARGLLLFLFLHGNMIHKIPFNLRIRFYIFKYLKLFFPFALLLLVITLIFLAMIGEYIFPISFLILFLLFLLNPATHKSFLQVMKFHYYFGIAVLLFIFGKQRSVFWERLKIDR